jgi:hypothetical protein
VLEYLQLFRFMQLAESLSLGQKIQKKRVNRWQQ